MIIANLLFYGFCTFLIGFTVYCMYLGIKEAQKPYEEREVAKRAQNVTLPKVEDIMQNEQVKAKVRCPYCRYDEYTIMKRGWKMTTGFIGSSKPVRVCNRCLKKF